MTHDAVAIVIISDDASSIDVEGFPIQLYIFAFCCLLDDGGMTQAQ